MGTPVVAGGRGVDWQHSVGDSPGVLGRGVDRQHSVEDSPGVLEQEGSSQEWFPVVGRVGQTLAAGTSVVRSLAAGQQSTANNIRKLDCI